MYTQFYGLREKPFSLSPDPKYLYLSGSHREALAHLLYGIEQGEGFIAITGEVGTGKTTLCRTLLQRLEPGTEVAFIFNPQLSGLELLQAIAAELGLEAGDQSRRELTEQLNRFLLAKRREGRRVLLIIDEAQTLDRDALEQVRLLSNLETNTAKLIQIILIGQPELDTILESPDLRQLRQRISVRWRLQPLSVTETREYVQHRLRIAAGAPREIFTELSVREIHRRSRGIPRVINLLCDRSLLAGYAAGAKAVGLGLVAETDREVRGGPRARSLAAAGGGVLDQVRDRLSEAPDWARRAALPAAVVGLLALAGFAGFLLGDDGAPAEPGLEVALATPPSDAALPGPTAITPTGPGDALPPVAALPPRAAPAQSLPSVAAPPPSTGPGPVAQPEPAVVPADADLGVTLARVSPAASAAASLDALLAHWSKDPLEAGVMSPTGVVAALRKQGFAIWNLDGATLDDLHRIDRPALLRVEALDGAERMVLVGRLDEETVTLDGLGARSVAFQRSALETVWTGRAIVAWLEGTPLPDVIGPWSSGEPVRWLQGVLSDLGHYQGTPNGEFDLATLAGVRALQSELGVGIDGTVGPETRIRLQDRRGAQVPRVAERREPSASQRIEPPAPARDGGRAS